MKRKAKFGILALVLALLASLGLNVYLAQKSRTYYQELNGVRLDPLGMKAYPERPDRPEPPIIVMYGDSRAVQWPAPDGVEGARFVNRGVGGQTTAQVLGRFDQHVGPLEPRVVVLQVGINDLKTIPLFPEQQEAIIADCKANIHAIVKRSLAIDARVVLTTIFPLGEVPLSRRLFWSEEVAPAVEEVNAFLASLAGDGVVVFATGPILATPEGIVVPRYSRDFLHLNGAGYAALNRHLADLLNP